MSKDKVTLLAEVSINVDQIVEFAKHLGVPLNISVSNPDWTSESDSDVAPTIIKDFTNEELLNRILIKYQESVACFVIPFHSENAILSANNPVDVEGLEEARKLVISGVVVSIGD